jgi:hypothetical protein
MNMVAESYQPPAETRRSQPEGEPDRWVAALLLVGFYYNAYRYPFAINSSGTSPTYSDTPLWLSAGKYLLIMLVLLYAVLVRVGSRRQLEVRRPLHVVGYLYLALMPIAAGGVMGSPGLALMGFFFLVPVVLHLFSGWSLSVVRLNRLLAATIYIAIAVEAIQVILFLALGRLPALAYRDSISVRFGSFLDDPNGFGILVCWFIPFAALYFGGWWRAAVIALLGVSLLLTQSLTGLGAFVVISAILVAWLVAIRPSLILPVSLAALILLLSGGLFAYLFREEISLAYTIFLLTKEGSLAGHATSFTAFGDLSVLSILGLEPFVERWEETGYVNLLAYFGITYLIVYVAMGVSAAIRYVEMVNRTGATRNTRAFAVGAIALLMAVYLGNLTLPMVEVYPINLFAATLMGLATAGLLTQPGAGAYAATRASARQRSIPALR